jgi:hypothetical protein
MSIRVVYFREGGVLHSWWWYGIASVECSSTNCNGHSCCQSTSQAKEVTPDVSTRPAIVLNTASRCANKAIRRHCRWSMCRYPGSPLQAHLAVLARQSWDCMIEKDHQELCSAFNSEVGFKEKIALQDQETMSYIGRDARGSLRLS